MNKKLTRLLMLGALCLAMGAHAQSNGDYRSVASGLYSVPATWEKYDSVSATWATPTTKPGSGNNVTVRTGHIVSMDAGSSTHNARALTIESNATLKSDGLAQRTLRVYGPTFTNSGTVGGGAGADSITLEAAQATGAVLFTGTGTTSINRMRAYYGVTSNITIDHSFSANYKGAAGFTGYYNNSSSSSADNVTITLNAGKTITLTDSSALHSNSTATANPGGTYIYNINGTLDMSGSGGTSNLVPNSLTATGMVKLNVSGLLKIGNGFNTSNSAPGVANGTVELDILAGGIVDASATRKLSMDSTTFIMGSGTSVFKRIVAAVDTVFPISLAVHGYNAVTMNNSGTTDVFSVSLKNIFDQTPPDATKMLNRQWTISEAVSGGTSATIRFAWLTADQASGFSPASVSIYRFAAGKWKEIPATVTGSGTLAAPYVATISSIDTLGIFGVGNSGIPITNVGIAGLSSLNGNITIAPNPVTGNQIHMQLTDLTAGSYRVLVYNLNGQKLCENMIVHSGNSSAHTIQLPANAAGIYEVRVTNGRQQMTTRILVH